MADRTLFHRTPAPEQGPFWSNVYDVKANPSFTRYGHPCVSREISEEFGATTIPGRAPIYRIKTTMKRPPQ